MVDVQLRRRGIRDERVLAAMNEIPREEFVPAESRLSGEETVLEVGAGCGYAAAVLGQVAARVVAVELIPGLAQLARENLHRTGRDANVTVVEGDGQFGYPPLAPYRGISVAAAAPEIPTALLDQLDDPGCLVIPVDITEDQELRTVWKRDGRIDYRVATLCRFVPLRGGGR